MLIYISKQFTVSRSQLLLLLPSYTVAEVLLSRPVIFMHVRALIETVPTNHGVHGDVSIELLLAALLVVGMSERLFQPSPALAVHLELVKKKEQLGMGPGLRGTGRKRATTWML